MKAWLAKLLLKYAPGIVEQVVASTIAKVDAALDDTQPMPWRGKDTLHVDKQIDSATSFKVAPRRELLPNEPIVACSGCGSLELACAACKERLMRERRELAHQARDNTYEHLFESAVGENGERAQKHYRRRWGTKEWELVPHCPCVNGCKSAKCDKL